MTTAINRDDAPSHLFNVPELDFSGDLFVEPLAGLWFRLGAWTITPRQDERGVEDVVSRQSLLLPPQGFAEIFDSLKCVGNVIEHLGEPGGSVRQLGEEKQYSYAPFHRFEFPFTSVTAEPLVFVHLTHQRCNSSSIPTYGYSLNWRKKHLDMASGGTHGEESTL